MTGSAADGFQIGHLIAQDSIDLFNTGYSVYQDQRNYQFSKDVFDYNKALQQEIFNREDTAYERKRRDLERAGLNPNLAAGGSGSAAGAIVGNSNQAGDHQLYKANLMANLGAYLDAKKASWEAKIAENQTMASNAQAQIKTNEETTSFGRMMREKFMSSIQNVFDSGDNPDLYRISIQNDLYGNFNPVLVKVDSPDANYDWAPLRLTDSKYWQSVQNGWQLDLNDLSQSNIGTKMLSTEESFQTSDKWYDRGLKIFDRILNGANTLNNFRNTSRQLRRRRF